MLKRMGKWLVLLVCCICVLTDGISANAQTVKKIEVQLDGVKSVGKTIQKALDEALEDQSGETLYEITLPQGTYKLDTLLKVFSYTTIQMEGCTLVRDTEKTMLRIGYEDDKYSGYNGMRDITIIGGCFDGNGENAACEGALIRMGHGQNITMRNVTLKNAYNAHHCEMAACKNVLIENCTFEGFYSNKKDPVNAANNEALQFDIMHLSKQFPKYPTLDDTPCANVTVTGCTFNNLQRGLGTHAGVAGSYFQNMKFTNNTFTNIMGYAMIATNYQDAEISGNVIKNCGSGILFRSMVQGYGTFYTPHSDEFTINNNANAVITNNTIQVSDRKYSTTAYGISLYGLKVSKKKKDVPKGNFELSGVTVENNNITMNNSGYGVWVQGTKNSAIKNNKVTMNIKKSVSGKGNSDCIRLVRSTKITIDRNVLTQKKNNKKTVSACGIILAEQSSATITNNKITNSPKDGIFLNQKSSATIKNNTINKAGRYGLNVCNKSKATSKKNKFTKCKKRKTHAYSGGKIKG